MKEILLGTTRVQWKDLQVYEKTKTTWKKSSQTFPYLEKIVHLFKANHTYALLRDTKNPRFLKGQMYKGQVQGARINILPNKQVLDKAYSLFADELNVHDQESHDHWDLLYKNKGGGYAYAYTVKKKKIHSKEKYKKVEAFDKVYTSLLQKVTRALKDKQDHLALPMYTLLKTYMRVGNEMYYKAHGHKGLTTLKKKDLSIHANTVIFKYIAKDGVPLEITHNFLPQYMHRLKEEIQKKKPNDFIFTSPKSSHPLAEKEFQKAFQRYTGQSFYPHIVRSHYATQRVKQFMKGKKRVSKEAVQQLFFSIAHALGHRRFQKKEKIWQENYNVTVHHYINPEVLAKVEKLERG